VNHIKNLIAGAKCILWNGPLGNYENGYTDPTKQVAQAIANTNALSLVGGGDTLAAIAELGIDSNISFISTGGGAMLDYLAQGTLPGLDALKK
jgi:phosphoglycerate kinase